MFRLIEAPWPRAEHFQHYLHAVRCTYSITVEIDITHLRQRLREKEIKLYPAQIYMLATLVNRFPAFRMGITPEGAPGYWDSLSPSYTVFHPASETFSCLWTPFRPAFSDFLESYSATQSRFGRDLSF